MIKGPVRSQVSNGLGKLRPSFLTGLAVEGARNLRLVPPEIRGDRRPSRWPPRAAWEELRTSRRTPPVKSCGKYPRPPGDSIVPLRAPEGPCPWEYLRPFGRA